MRGEDPLTALGKTEEPSVMSFEKYPEQANKKALTNSRKGLT